MELFGVEMEHDGDGYLVPANMPDWQRRLAKQFMREARVQWVAINMPRQMT